MVRVVRFNERGPGGLVDGKARGAPSLLSAEQRHALFRVVETGVTLHLIVRIHDKHSQAVMPLCLLAILHLIVRMSLEHCT